MKKLNSKGFSALEVALVVIVMGIIGGSGYYVYDSQKETNTLLDTAGQQAQDSAPAAVKEQAAANETADWKLVENTDFGYSFKMPATADWVTDIAKSDVGSPAYADGERISNHYVNYNGCGNNCGLAFSISTAKKNSKADVGATYPETTLMKNNSSYSLQSKTPLTIGGADSIRWEYANGDSDAANIVYYYITKNQLSYFVQVNMNGSTTDDLNVTVQGDKIASTLSFL